MSTRPSGTDPATYTVPFNQLHRTGAEMQYIGEAIEASHLSAAGDFSRRCARWLEAATEAHSALLTHTCTDALEMTVLLSEIGPGDEVIMPSFTFVSTANAFALRGATPVFVDIRADTLNLDERLVEQAITSQTKAIVAVHYGGVACDMDALQAIASRHGLRLIEDAAHALHSTYKGRPLGAIGDLGTLSFHETKNVISGEGGALLIGNDELAARAEILLEKGTNRSAFLRGDVDKYTWVDVGSSFGASELMAAFLYAQLEHADTITASRLAVWDRYHEAFAEMESRGRARRPIVPPDCRHGGHLYYLLATDGEARDGLIDELRTRGVQAVFHYVPLHSAPAGLIHGRAAGELTVTDDVSRRLVRLPLWPDMQPDDVDHVIAETRAALLQAEPV
jgi:dTDP-4-amino-4,6-dideoxygalactose transaminase